MGEKDENIKLGIMVNGNFQDIKEVQEITLVDTEINEELIHIFQPQSMTFTSNISPLELMEIILDKASLTRYYQSHKSNNWLKMHGIPMRRKSVIE